MASPRLPASLSGFDPDQGRSPLHAPGVEHVMDEEHRGGTCNGQATPLGCAADPDLEDASEFLAGDSDVFGPGNPLHSPAGGIVAILTAEEEEAERKVG
jgi:hypothetical protein